MFLLVLDMILCSIAGCLAAAAHCGDSLAGYADILAEILPAALYGSLVGFCVFGLYNNSWRHGSIEELSVIVYAATASCFISFIGISLLENAGFYSAIAFSYYLGSIVLVGLGRQLIRLFRYSRKRQSIQRQAIVNIRLGN